MYDKYYKWAEILKTMNDRLLDKRARFTRKNLKICLFRIAFAVLLSAIPNSTYAADDPYAALGTLLNVTTKNITQTSCSISATLNFEEYPQHLPLFRDAWLNKEFSVDFYNQRRKQVFVYVVAKRAAELITGALYAKADNAPEPECRFQISINANDKFGQPREYPALSWRFTKAQSAKVAWQTYDPKNFQDIAIDYRIRPEINEWIADEPSMNGPPTAATRDASPRCDERFLEANAIFIRATTYCKKNYMDTRAGYFALEKSRHCVGLPEAELMPKIQSAMQKLDSIVKSKGKQFGCRWVGDIEQSVLQAMPN